MEHGKMFIEKLLVWLILLKIVEMKGETQRENQVSNVMYVRMYIKY
jgi:hypothetical protein